MKLSEKKARELGIPIPKRQDSAGRKRKAKGDATPGHSARARQAMFYAMCEAWGIDEPVAEYEFAPGRKFRFDYLIDGWLAVEVQGGIHTGGRHVRGGALEQEYEKLNLAVLEGYSVLFFTPEQIDNGSAFAMIRKVLDSIGGLS